MLKRIRSSLRYKISAQMLFLSLVPLAIVGLVVYLVMSDQLDRFSGRLGETEDALRSDVVGANLANIADSIAVEIDTYLLERIRDLRRWAETPILIRVARQANRVTVARGLGTASQSEIEAALDAQSQSPLFLSLDEANQPIQNDALAFLFEQQEKSRGTFVEIIVTEASGINLLITRPVDQRVHREDAWWLDARQAGLGGVGIIDARLDPAIQHPVVAIALPIVDPDTKSVLGVIRGTVDLTEVQLLVSRRTALVPDAQAHVFTRKGDLLVDTASQNNLETLLNPTSNRLAQDGSSPARSALEAEEVPGFVSLVDQARARIVGYSRTSGSSFYDQKADLLDFAGFGWGVTVSQPEETALQVLEPLLDLRQALERQRGVISGLILGAAGLTAAATLLVALLLARNIANPLVFLSRMTERVRAGEYQVQVDVTSQDEIGTLQDAFNLMVQGLNERERIRDLFGRAVSPEVAEQFLDGQFELGGETRQVTVLFSDIRGFTSLSEPLSPQQIIAFVNEFLTEMHAAIQGVGGVVHKLGGDSIMALFGAPVPDPNSPTQALQAALGMRARLASLNQRRLTRGDVPLRIGIGINTGLVVAGGVGSQDRLEYTVLGDAVNVAARLESLTKEYPDYDILISETTLQALSDDYRTQTVDLGEVRVKGKTEAVRVFAVD